LFVAPEDKQLAARVRVAHYLQLVRAELHLATNSGASVSDCAHHARRRVPFWDDDQIADASATEAPTRNCVRIYGIDWFVRLADHEPTLGRDVLRAAYRDPLTPTELMAMWPDGPCIGGPGGSIDLRP